MNAMMKKMILACLLILFATTSSFGRNDSLEETIEQETGADSLKARLIGGVWIPRLGGTTRLGPSSLSREFSLESTLALDDLTPSLNVELLLEPAENWRIFVGGFTFSADVSGRFNSAGDFGNLTLNPGDLYSSDFDFTSAVVEWQIDLLRPLSLEEGDKASLQFSGILGMRYAGVNHSITTQTGGKEDADGSWFMPLVGAQMNLQYEPQGNWSFIKRLEIEGGGGMGTSLNGGLMWQVRVHATAYFTDHFGLTFGYRLVELNVDDDDYELDGGLQGLFIAGTVRF